VRSNSRRGLRTWSILASVAIGLSLAACGGDDDDDAGASATTADGAAGTTAAGAATTADDATATTGGSDTTAGDATATTGGSDTTAGEATETAGSGTPGSAAPDDPELVAAATEEGKVTIYSSQGLDALEEMATNFEAKYPGIDVEVVRGIDSDLAPKVEAENQTGQGVADVYVNASLSWVVDHAEQGWFLPVEGPELTGEGAYDAEQYVHDGNYFEVGAAVLTFAWNTELYEAGVTDYPDLLDPELQGQMGVIEPTAPSIVDFYLWLEETYGEDYVEQLAALEPRIYPSSLPIGEALAAGEIAATPYAAPQTLVPLAEQGAPVEFGIGPQGAWGARFFGMVLTSAPNPNAGQLLANYMVTAEAQEVLQAAGGSVLPDIPGTLITNAETREQDLSKLTPEAVAAYQEKWNGLFR
jgi:iron(III) transport system substrate-binding protein